MKKPVQKIKELMENNIIIEEKKVKIDDIQKSIVDFSFSYPPMQLKYINSNIIPKNFPKLEINFFDDIILYLFISEK